MSDKLTPIQSRFDELDTKRNTQLKRAYHNAEISFPLLFPDPDISDDGYYENLPVPYSSKPAKGITRLASTTMINMFPPLQPFHEYDLAPPFDPEAENKPTEEVVVLNRLAQYISDRLEPTNLRPAMYIALLYAIVVGDVLVYEDDDMHFFIYKLDQYVLERDPSGELREMVLMEWIDPETLPSKWDDVVANEQPTKEHPFEKGFEGFYTWMKREGRGKKAKWKVVEEFRGTSMDRGTFDVPPYWSITWMMLPGEDYGRSLVDALEGDLLTLDSLTRALVEGSNAAAEWRGLVDPSGLTEVDDLQYSNNGDYIPGRDQDVNFKSLGSQIQLQTTAATQENLSREVADSFLDERATQPTGERVTAAQIRRIAELNARATGGISVSAAKTIQEPVIRRTTDVLIKMKKLNRELKVLEQERDLLEIRIRSGIDALGRELENSAIFTILELSSFLQPEERRRLDIDTMLVHIVSNTGLDPETFLKSDEQLQQEEAQRQQQQAADQRIQTAGAVVETAAQNATAQQ